MKRTSSFIVSCILVTSLLIPGSASAQKQTYDLVTYTPPKGWKKDLTENTTIYTIVNKKNSSWCRINIVKSTTSKGSIEQDFDSEWQELIVKSYQPTEAPKLNKVQEAKGWKIKAGAVKFIFNGASASAMLTTMSGYDRCISIVATTNSQDYLKNIDALLTSVDLVVPKKPTQTIPVNNSDNASIIGTWDNSASDQSNYSINNGVNGYIVSQYTFRSDGTYTFYTKTFKYEMDKLLLTRENGTYQINGNNITITPQKSRIEAWTKKIGDTWGKLVSSQNKILEKQTYQFVKHYFSGMKEWDLVLQADKQTQRDGPFNGGTAFSHAWIYSPGGTPSHPLIKLPD